MDDQWGTKGAQEFPLGIVVVPNETVSQELNSSSVVYVGRSVGEQLMLISTHP